MFPSSIDFIIFLCWANETLLRNYNENGFLIAKHHKAIYKSQNMPYLLIVSFVLFLPVLYLLYSLLSYYSYHY